MSLSRYDCSDKSSYRVETTLRSVIVIFATDNSGPEALADILAVLPNAAKVI